MKVPMPELEQIEALEKEMEQAAIAKDAVKFLKAKTDLDMLWLRLKVEARDWVRRKTWLTPNQLSRPLRGQQKAKR